HAEGQPVAAHLDEFLAEHGTDTLRGEILAHPLALISSMSTSSSVLVPGDTRTFRPSTAASTAFFSLTGSRPTTCSVAPNEATCSTPSRASRRSAIVLQ